MNMRIQNKQYQELREAGWRRALTRDEETALRQFLSAHPEGREAWGEEAALNRLLERMPVAPVSSNFTARVLRAAQSAPPRSAWRDWFAPAQWLPESVAGKLALCSLMVCVGVLSFHEYQAMHRARIAREVADASRVAALPPMEWLKDFDTINGLSRVKVADDDLLAAMQ
jgi:hypothetical protein